MEQQAECAVCGNAAFELLDGLYFCSDCGTQSQDVREEVTDATGEAGDGVGFLRLLRSSTKKKGGSPTVKEEGESLNQLEIFQLILQKQCDALIGLGVDPSIKEAVQLIWFHYLRHYGYAFTDSKTQRSIPRRRLPQKPSPYIPVQSEKKEFCSSTKEEEEPSDFTKTSSKVAGDGATPKRRGRGRPRKEFSELRTKNARYRRPDDAAQYAAQVGGSDVEKRNLVTRKRLRKDCEESSNATAKRIKTEKEEQDVFDFFPSDEHLFSPAKDTDSMDGKSGSEEGGVASDSDSEQELTGVDLFLQRRRETQVVVGQTMLSYFSLKYTVCLCYLGLLYIKHNILLVDLVRWVGVQSVLFGGHHTREVRGPSLTTGGVLEDTKSLWVGFGVLEDTVHKSSLSAIQSMLP